MAAIDEASKKLEKSNSAKKIKTYLLCAIVAVSGFLAAKMFFNFIASSFQNANIVIVKPHSVTNASVNLYRNQLTPTPQLSFSSAQAIENISVKTKGIKKPLSPAFVLNGIVISSDASYALINNKIVMEGDKIDGATVVRIAKDAVELKSDDSKIKLSPDKR